MATTSTDRIEKQIVLRAPRARVWRALTDLREFGSWFGVKMETGFAPGAVARGRITYPGYEHLVFEATVERMEPERLLAWRWHPAPLDAAADYSKEPTTLVTLTLEETPEGTRLTVVESGFDQLPLERRAEAFRMNEGGWAEQMRNVERHVSGA
ncbi:SRPBCC family protein [Anaeromyxobacter terrae]|uniref:SRPBCC family protein n=1 Tax=Anaeromyxobacter terrae TaxID=2925406 RepID=UPI001F5A4CDE|nr:SRPBCC family protein [Anaeromyxobacter sp. SG22]